MSTRPYTPQDEHASNPQSSSRLYDAATTVDSPLPHNLHHLNSNHVQDHGVFGAPSAAGAVEEGSSFSAQHGGLDNVAQADHVAGNLAQGVLAIEGQSPGNAEPSSSRKKPKVSKACDECRRKKIRCDITTDTPTNPCTACDRSGSTCTFSRQQLKRGPSKGYIKELASRLSTLESQLGPQAYQAQYGNQPPMMYPETDYQFQDPSLSSPEAGPSDTTASSRKRKHADMQFASVGQRLEFDQNLHHSEDNVQPDFGASSAPSRTAFHPSTPQPIHSNNSIWRHGLSEIPRRQPVGVPYGQEQREADNEILQGWDEEVVDEYYRLVHQTFPLLPHSKLRLRSRLIHCPPTLREAFLVALDAAMRDSPTSKLASLDTSIGAQRAAALIAASQFDNTSNRTMSANLIYIQTLILMALESDHHGPATMRGHIGPPRSEWLGRAAAMAHQLKLNALYPKDRFGEGDPDADEKLGRRVWWVLFILDRWHASSTSQLLQLSENSTSLLLEDHILLGESTYHLVRLSYILGHLSAILQQSPVLMSRGSAAAPIITTIILGELDRFRESVESVLLGAPNLVHLSYWHVRLMVLRLTSSTDAMDLLTPASRMANLLNSSYTPLTPLNHHFAALAAMTLVELADFAETRDGAKKGIEDILEAHSSKRGFEARENSTGWDGAIRELLEKRKLIIDSCPPTENGSTLRHLLESAGALGQSEVNGAATSSVFDPTRMTRYGFLAALVQENRM